DVVRLLALVLHVVRLADTRALRARVAVAAAVAVEEEAAAEAGVGQTQDAVDVGDRLAGGGDAVVRAVVVEAVAPFVVEDRGDLPGVPAAASLAVEVDGGAVPERVAGVVDVHVRGDLAVQPPLRGGVLRQAQAPALDLPVQLVEARAARMRVTRRVAGRD